MATDVTAKETLTCPSCGQERASAKTIGKDGGTTVTCPQCKSSSSLGNWRANPHRGAAPPALTTPVSIPSPPGGESNDEQNPQEDSGAGFFGSRHQELSAGEIIAGVVVSFVAVIALCVLAVLLIGALGATLGSLVEILDGSHRSTFKDDYAPGKTANEIQLIRSDLAFIRNLILLALASVAFWKAFRFVTEGSLIRDRRQGL